MNSINRRKLIALTGGTALSAAAFGSRAFAQSVRKPVSSKPVEGLMKEQALPDIVVGDENAPVTIIEYASLTCPHCRSFHVNTYPEIKKMYVDTGKVKMIKREFPFDPLATAGFMLARCAPGDKRDAMIDVLFEQQEKWSRAQKPVAELLQISKLAGFTQESFEKCLTNQALLDKVNAVRNAGANDYGVASTPTFYINGLQYSGDMSVAEMSSIIDALL